jgi:hypothetical protein
MQGVSLVAVSSVNLPKHPELASPTDIADYFFIVATEAWI